MNLEQRVVELERRTARYRNALVMLVVGVCAVAVVGATTDDGIIKGRHLFLQNAEGETIVALGAVDGNGLLTVSSKNGTELIYAGAAVDGHGLLTVSSKTGTELIYAGAAVDGNGVIKGRHLLLNNAEGEVVVALGFSESGNGMLKVKSKTGTDLIHAGAAGESGHGLLTVSSNTGTDLIYAGADGGSGHGLLTVASKTGAKRTSIASDEDGFIFAGYNKTGDEVVQLYADEYGNGYIGAFDRKGNG